MDWIVFSGERCDPWAFGSLVCQVSQIWRHKVAAKIKSIYFFQYNY